MNYPTDNAEHCIYGGKHTNKMLIFVKGPKHNQKHYICVLSNHVKSIPIALAVKVVQTIFKNKNH